MCYFLFIAVPTDAVDHIKSSFARGFQVRSATNQSLLRVLPTGYSLRVVTSGGCSCELYSKSASTCGLTESVTTRLEQLCSDAGGLAVLVHWFSGDIDSEPIKLTKSSCASRSLADFAAQLREDQLLIASHPGRT
jgi:hypothetical protein